MNSQQQQQQASKASIASRAVTNTLAANWLMKHDMPTVLRTPARPTVPLFEPSPEEVFNDSVRELLEARLESRTREA